MLRMRVMGGPNREPDPLLRALDLRTGDFVLDATVGRGGDAVMIALAVGATGRVVGLEASGIIAAITRLGLATYEEPDAAIREAMRRVHVIHANHERYLASCREGSFDIVYFDPMFDRPLTHCPSIDPIRTIATHETLSGEALLEAQRVARRRVVVKNRKGSDTLESLGIHTIVGGRWSRVEYGVVE
jgi:hypothetical protein